jgi:hypothetical protein
VACRIHKAQDGDRVIVVVAGRVEEAHVGDLNRLCSEDSRSVVLDLTDVLSADHIAVEALRRLRNRGVSIVGAPRYLQFTLDDPR